MRRFALRALFSLLFIFGNLSCTVNVLENFADKTTDEAYFYDALGLINDGSYQAALDKIALMSSGYQARREVVNLKVDAHGGLCGINFLSFAEALGSLSGNLFTFLMSTYRTGTLTNADSCLEAEDLLESLGAAADRTTDENVSMMVIGFAKVGSILGHYADTDDNGTPDAGYDVCASAVGTDISDAYAREVGSGITLALEALTEIASSVNLGSGSLTAMSGVCADLAIAGLDFCDETDPAAFTATEVRGIRSMLKEDSAVGLGANCSGDVSACFCP